MGEGGYALKLVAVEMKEAMWFEKMRLVQGDSRTRWSGMMGLVARVSARRKRGVRMAEREREASTKGCDQGRTLPPRVW